MLRAVALAAAAVPAFAGTAVAAEVRVTGSDTVTYTAAPGEVNAVVVSPSDDATIRITDGGATIVAGARCRATEPGAVICSPPPARNVPPGEIPDYPSLDVVRISTADLDDQIESTGPRLVADGGPGEDLIRGVAFNDVLDGGPGRDRLFGEGRLIDADPESLDEFDGRGGGVVDYSRQPGPLTVELDTLRSSAGDDLRAITGVVGSRASDTLLGSDGRNHVRGWTGDDRLIGRRGNDVLNGGAGDDTARGDAGDDSVRGSTGRDRLSGGDGSDGIMGGDDADRLSGGNGDDGLGGGRGIDRYACGPGADSLYGPERDELVPLDCESIGFGYARDTTIEMTPHPISTDGGRLVFSSRCPSSLGSRVPGYGRLSVRDRVSRRLIARASISRWVGHGCGDRGAQSLTFLAPLTAYGHERLRRRVPVDATVSVRGPRLPSAAWRIPLRISG